MKSKYTIFLIISDYWVHNLSLTPTKEPNNEIKKKKKKNRFDPFLPHVVDNGKEIMQRWGGRQIVVKAKQINRR